MRRVVVLFSVSIAIVVGLLIFVVKCFQPDNVGIEVVKSLLQLLVVVLLGSVISLAVKEFNVGRQRIEAIQEFRKATLSLLGGAYSSTKRSRRLLRAKGLSLSAAEDDATMVIHQDMYSKQMEEVINAQLNLEAIGTEVETAMKNFDNAVDIISDIRTMDEYLNLLIDEYEESLRNFDRHSKVRPLAELPKLLDFIGPYRDSRFRTDFVERYKSLLKAIQKDVLVAGE